MFDFIHSNPWTSFCILLGLFTFSLLFSSYRERSHIRRLGAFPPLVPSYVPFGLDLAFRSLYHSYKFVDLIFWDWVFSHSPNEGSPTVELYVGRQRFIFTADPENIKAVLTTQFQDYGKGLEFHEDWKHFLGDGIFNTDHDKWHASRQLIRPQFVKERVRDLDIFEHHVQKVIAKLDGHGQEIDIATLFYRYTLDAATDYLLGHSIGSLDNPQVDFAEDFNEVQRVQSQVTRMGPLKLFLPKRSLWRALRGVDNFVEPYVEQALRMNLQDLKQLSNPSFLQAVAATGTRDRKVIRDQCVNILLAGRDTTAGTLSFLFLALSRHPEVVAKLRREIIDKVGNSERPTYEDLKTMPYLKNIMNEVLRLYPSVPFNVRMSLHDTTLPTGGGHDGQQPIGVAKDTYIAYTPLLMQRREDLYPPSTDVLAFRPERWEKWTPKPWQYIPFNGGPRICIGQQFALTEIGYTVIRILQRFDRIDCYSPSTGPEFKCEVVLSPVEGVKVGLWSATA